MAIRFREAIREPIRLGFNRYELIASPVGESDYRGAWRCTLCKRGERSAISHPRPAAALEWARNCVIVHHLATHPEPDDPT